MTLDKQKLEAIARDTPALPVLRADGQFVMDGDKNVAFVMLEGEVGAQVAKFFAGADATIHSLLFEVGRLQRDAKTPETLQSLLDENTEIRRILAATAEALGNGSVVDRNASMATLGEIPTETASVVRVLKTEWQSSVARLQKRIGELEKDSLEWRKIVDNERQKLADAITALDYWKGLANALQAQVNAIKPPVMDGNPPSHVVLPGMAPIPTLLSPAPQPYPPCVNNPGVFPQPVATELKASRPKEYSVIYAENIDALTAGVRHQIAEGWQPAGGICAENFDAVFKPQPATRFYQAITR